MLSHGKEKKGRKGKNLKNKENEKIIMQHSVRAEQASIYQQPLR